jgi:hypothetical protein
MRLGRPSHDALALLLLVGLWLLFFWRLFTPVEADQASIVKGDFSGQFVAFAGYQYQRFTHGEVPLWNPYNNGGFPFIGDPQAAVFYPPRLATIALSYLYGGWSYHALELEMTVHVLAYSLFMYVLVRRMTLENPGSVYGGFTASAISSYGGFMSGYPPLQLAILESGVWLPLAVLGIVEATRCEKIRWPWLALTGFTFGLSWLAGHSQTSWFLTYGLLAYLAYRTYTKRYSWTRFLAGVALFSAIAFGVAAVQLLPGVEYLAHSTRTGLSFDDKGNGFPFQDVAQFIFPRVVSVYSPLYVGIVGLALALIAVWRRLPQSLFWGIVTVSALGLSFGANSAIYPALYNLLPGLHFFRGQERAAYLVANSLAILAGLGAAHLITWDRLQDFKATRQIQRALFALLVISGGITLVVFALWLGNPDAYGALIGPVAFSVIVALLASFIIPWLLANPQHVLRLCLLAGLIVFELFTVNMDAPSNYDPIPPHEQLSMTAPRLVERALLADTDLPRVDGFRGLHDNHGSLYGLMDVRGISPLFLAGPYTIIYPDTINPRAWELFAVRMVFSDWQELPVPGIILASGEDRYGPVNLHLLTDPRPLAHLLYNVVVVDSDAAAYALLDDATFDPRRTVILGKDPGLSLASNTNGQGHASMADFRPESINVSVTTPTDAILSIPLPQYPGWEATIDGHPTEILRAYGALSAVHVPSGDHTIEFVYDPVTYRIGAIGSLLTWAGIGIVGIILVIRGRTAHVHD